MHVGGIVDAYRQNVRVLGFDDLKGLLNPEWIGINGSPTNVAKSFTKQAKGEGKILAGLSVDEAVAAIMDTLVARHII